ncbi:MAG: esterase [Saccharofermentans sp.]|nr:esterase [Saccharofermentans sp.]
MQELTYGNKEASNVLIQLTDRRELELMPEQVDKIHEITGSDIFLRAFVAEDWNKDLSPWQAPAVFGKEDFGGGAKKTLEELEARLTDKDKTYYIGGYSLSGLFAIWSAYNSDLFTGVAAASPSMWFPSFTDYMRYNRINADKVCLSLGDKEANTRNPVMSQVAARMQEARDILTSQGTDTTFEWNEGGHFRDPELRTAKVFASLIV